MDQDGREQHRRDAKDANDKPSGRVPAPGKYASTDNYGSGGTDVATPVPGKRSLTEQLYANESVGTQAYAGGPNPAPASRGERAGGGRSGPAALRESFEVQSWSAGTNAPPLRVGSGHADMSIGVQATGIAANASVRPLTPEAQRYSVGFVQTIHDSRRLAIYETEPGVVANQWLSTRGEMLDQRTDLGSPAPWYNYGLSLAGGTRTPGMADNPWLEVPQYSPEYALLSRLEGSESFTTYLVVMLDNNPSTIIYLGNVRWSVTWTGRFDESYREFTGAGASVGGATRGEAGGAVLSGPTANDGPPGAFVGASGGRTRRGGHAYASSVFGAYAYGDPPQTETDQQRVDRLRGEIVPPLRPIADEFLRDPSLATIDRARVTVFGHLFGRGTGFETLTTYLLAVPANRQLLDAVTQVDLQMSTDRSGVEAIERACSQAVGGGRIEEATGICMVEYPRLSVTARRFLRDRPIVHRLGEMPEPSAPPPPTMVASPSRSDEQAPATSQSRALYRLVHGDMGERFAIDAVASAAAPPGAPPVPPEIQTAFTQLKARILREVPAPAPNSQSPSDGTSGVDHQVLADLRTAIRESDSRVRDMISRDAEVQSRLTLALPVLELRQMNVAIDSLEGLAQQCYPTVTPGQPAAPPNRFALIRDYLAQRPGPENADLRQQVLAHATLSQVIAAFNREERDTILRLVARGTATPAPVDAIYAAARNEGTSVDALRGAIQLDQDRLTQLRSELMFQQALEAERNRAVAELDNGLRISVRDYVLRAWGQAPDAPSTDPASALSRPWVNPSATETTPPTPEEWQQINTIIERAINAIAPRLSSWGWFDGLTEDRPIVDALQRYERECAAETVRSIFRRANLAPGPELVRRANADSRIGNLQQRLYRCLGEEGRQAAERVLGLRADAAAVGSIGGQVRLPEDDRSLASGQGHVPLQQALAEVTITDAVHLSERDVVAGATLSQLIRIAAEDLCRELNEGWGAFGGPDREDVDGIFSRYTAAFDSKKADLATATGMQAAQLRAIDFLRNAFRELPDGHGDLRERINQVMGGGAADITRTQGLDAPPPPAEQTRLRTAGEALCNAIRGYYDPGYADLLRREERNEAALERISNERRERAGRVRTAFEAARQLETAPGAADTAPASPPPLPGQPPGQAGPQTVAAGAPTTITAWYRQEYGIEPERHVIELARHTYTNAVARVREVNEGRTEGRVPDPSLADIGALFGVPAGRIDMAMAAPPDPVLTSASAEEQRQANEAADRLWRAVRGDGDIVAIRREIDGRRRGQQQQILAAFRVKSGGIDLDFYLRQAIAHTTQLGAEGARAQGAAVGTTEANLRGDTGSLQETLAVTQTGTVGFLVRIRVALETNYDRNELFRLLDDASLEERRAVLGDEGIMRRLRGLGEEDYDRAYGVLNGTATLATRLRARGEGSTGMDPDSSGLNGMQRDIRDWCARRNELYLREREAGRNTYTNEQIRERVRLELQQQFADPALRAIIDDESRNWWDTEGEAEDLESRMLNGGEEQHTGSLLSRDTFISVDSVIAQVGQMSAAERERLRSDPEFLRRIEALGPSEFDRRRIFDALRGLNDSAEDHVGQLTALVRGSGSADEILAAIAHLDQAEYRRVTQDTALIDRIMGRLQYDSRALAQARQMLAFNPTTASDRTGIVGTNFSHDPIPGEIPPAERERLAFLQHQAQSHIRSGAFRSYIQLMTETVRVYRMDFRPRAANIPNTPPSEPPAGESGSAARGRLAAPTVVERHALELRQGIWTEEIQTIVNNCVDANRIPERTKIDQMRIIEQGVKGLRDPSYGLVEEGARPGFLGNNDASADEGQIRAAISGASDQIIVDEWSSVANPAFDGDGGRTLVQVYDAYRDARSLAPEAPNRQDQIDQTRIAYQRYVIQPSHLWENMVLGSTQAFWGGRTDTSPTQSAGQNASRDNPTYIEYRRLLNERIRNLDMSLVARKIGAEGNDAAMLSSGIRTAEQGLGIAAESHGQQRAGGSTTVASSEGRQMDRAMGDYHRAVQSAEDQTAAGERNPDGSFRDIPAADQRSIQRIDADFTARRAEFQQAREKAAEAAALVVGVLIGVCLAVLVPGPGTAAAMALYSAMVSAAAATGQVLTREAILGNTYDAAGDGVKTIAAAAATGAVAGGAQFYSGQIVNALAPTMTASGTAAAQAAALSRGVSATAPAWQAILREGGRAMVQTSITGVANTVGSVIEPSNWLQGWNEGFYRARDAGAAQIRQLPGQAVRMAVASMASAAASRGLARAGYPQAPTPAAVGERAGMGRVADQLIADLPSNIVSSGVTQALEGPQTPSQFAQGLLRGVAESARDVNQGMQAGTLSGSRQTQHQQIHVAREVAAHQAHFTTGEECVLFQQAVMGTPEGMAMPTAAQFLAARNAMATAHITGDLTPAQREAFARWVRAGSTTEFEARARRNPLEIPEVANARPGSTPGTSSAPATTPQGQAAQTHVAAARTAATEARTAADRADAAEEAYHANPTPENGQATVQLLAEHVRAARAADERAQAALAAARLAKDQGGLSPEARAEVDAAFAEAQRHATETTTMAALVALARARVLSDVGLAGGGRPGGDSAQPTQPTDAPSPDARPPRPPEVRPNELSPDDYLLFHALVQQHGQEEGTRRFREEQARRQPRAGTEINASMLQGSDFVGHGRTAPAAVEVMTRANEYMRSLSALAGRIPGVERIVPDGTGWRVYLLGGAANGDFTLRISAVPLGAHQVARSMANSEAGIHNVELNDRVADTNIARGLAHEIAELAAIQRQAQAGGRPVTRDALTAQPFVPGSQLSFHDAGRVAELNQLGSELQAATAAGNAEEVARLRGEMTALVERLGLRQGAQGAQERMGLIREMLTRDASTALTDLTLPEGQLSTADSAALERFRTRSRQQQAMVDEQARRDRELHPQGLTTEVPASGRVSDAMRQQLNERAFQARVRRSREVTQALRSAQPLPDEPYPRAPSHVQLGGGAAAAAVTPDTLFIDALGRWHVDESGHMAQTAQQLGDMRGLGDTQAFGGPTDRVHLETIRFMINNAAAQARCVNVREPATLTMEGVHLVLTIHPDEASGGGEIKLLVDPSNIPVSAPGFPTEKAPRPYQTAADVAPTEAVNRVRTRLEALGIAIPDSLRGNRGDTDANATAWNQYLNETRVPDPNPPPAPPRREGEPEPPPPTISLADLLRRQPGARPDETTGAIDSLDCSAAWHEAQLRLGRGARGDEATLLRGDEAALMNFAEHPNTNWVIAGVGGTSISIAENILRQTAHRTGARRVTVRMIGMPNSETLATNTQWRQVMSQHCDPTQFPQAQYPQFYREGGDPPDGRLQVERAPLGRLEVDANGQFIVGGQAHGGYILTLGRDPQVPASIAGIVSQALRDRPDPPDPPGSDPDARRPDGQLRTLRGQILVDTAHDGQYLGYRIIVHAGGADRRFDFIGGASRFLPTPPFTAAEQALYNPETSASSRRDAPSGAGNFAGGFAASANQTTRYGQWRREEEEEGRW